MILRAEFCQAVHWAAHISQEERQLSEIPFHKERVAVDARMSGIASRRSKTGSRLDTDAAESAALEGEKENETYRLMCSACSVSRTLVSHSLCTVALFAPWLRSPIDIKVANWDSSYLSI